MTWFLAQNGETALHDVTYFTGVSRQGTERLEKLGGWRPCGARRNTEYPEKQYTAAAEEITLNDEQQRAYDTWPRCRMAAPASRFCRG